MPSSERNRESSSRRSRSSGSRSRSRHSRERHRHGSRHRHRSRHKQKEKNFWSAVCSMLSIVIMCTSLAEPKWIYFHGGGCLVNSQKLDHLGAYQFFYPGKFVTATVVDDHPKFIYKFGAGLVDKMENCVTYKAVILIKTIIAFTFIAMFCTLVAFILDLLGPSQRALKLLRRNAILNIVSVILCVIINLFCYWLTAEVESLQKLTKLHKGNKVVVSFDISFYLIAGAGAVGVVATAFNCLRRYPVYEESQSESLLDDYDGMEGILPPEPDVSHLANLPPPPAYSP